MSSRRSSSSSGTEASPAYARVCDGAVIAATVWTIACHANVALGGSLHTLLATAVALGLPAAVAWWRWGDGRPVPRATPAPMATAVLPPLSGPFRVTLLVVGATSALWLGFRWPSALGVWWWTTIMLSVAAVGSLATASPPLRINGTDRIEGIDRIDGTARSRRLLWLVAGLCVVLALIVHRPDWDDSLNINLAVAVADAPGAALLAHDTMHDLPNLPQLPVYRVHSYELWNGAISYITRIPAIYSFHWITAALAAFFAPLAFARLLRELTPRRWLWTLAALIVVLLAVGEPHRWYGNFFLVRIWQGKAIFLSVLLPLIYTYALRFGRRADRRDWILLCAAQIAAVGCTSTALWAGPASALLALASATLGRERGLRNLALGSFASAYVLLAGWLLRGSMQSLLRWQSFFRPDVSFSEPADAPGALALVIGVVVGGGLVATIYLLRDRFPVSATMAATSVLAGALLVLAGRDPPDQEEFGSAVYEVLGAAPLAALTFAVLGLAWATTRDPTLRGFSILVPLGSLLFLFNPYLLGFLRENVTGFAVWRGLWVVPVPLCFALVATAPLEWGRLSRRSAVASMIALVTLFALFVPGVHGLSAQNKDLWIGMPGVKAHPDLYRAARELQDAAGAGRAVAGPDSVVRWIPTFHDRARPLIVYNYINRHQETLGQESYRTRGYLRGYLSGDYSIKAPRYRKALRGFRAGLETMNVVAVCFHADLFPAEGRLILKRRGFRKSAEVADFEIWSLPSHPQQALEH